MELKYQLLPIGQRPTLAPLLPCTSTSSPHDLRLTGRSAVAIQSMELTMKASPAPQGGIRPLAAHALSQEMVPVVCSEPGMG